MEGLLLSFGSIKVDWQHAILSLILSFLLACVIAVVYERTFKGLSFSANFVQALVLGPLVSCIIMIAIGDNVARGIGLVGSLAIIRFRTNLRDPRDLVFLFASLGLGVACGVQSYSTALAGAVMFSLAALTLNATLFGQRRQFDGLLRFQLPSGGEASQKVAEILGRIPSHFALVTKRSQAQGEVMDYAYQVRLKNDTDGDKMIQELERVEGLRGLVYVNEQTSVEV